MARSYKRDKNGRFASGSGGGGSLRSTVQKKRSIGQARTYKPAANTPQGREVKRLTGSDKAVVGTRRVAAGSMGKPGRRANVKLEKQRNASIVASSGASSRGKSLRQTVKAKTSVGVNKTYASGEGKTTRAGFRAGAPALRTPAHETGFGYRGGVLKTGVIPTGAAAAFTRRITRKQRVTANKALAASSRKKK